MWYCRKADGIGPVSSDGGQELEEFSMPELEPGLYTSFIVCASPHLDRHGAVSETRLEPFQDLSSTHQRHVPVEKDQAWSGLL